MASGPPDDAFLVDGMCGGVLSYLRMCGYDAAFAPDRGLEADDAIAAAARDEERTVVTRDRALAETAESAILLQSLDPDEQLRELADAGVDLSLPDEPVRCGACNGRLAAVPVTEVTPDAVPGPDGEPVWVCRACGQHFWRGSHWDRVAERISDL